MAKVIAGITISLNGYITGPNDRVGAGLGDGGERLHYQVFASEGALLCGGTMHSLTSSGVRPRWRAPAAAA